MMLILIGLCDSPTTLVPEAVKYALYQEKMSLMDYKLSKARQVVDTLN